ncbi:hypothetical protein BDY19DRAFT_298223 [Irpex rosettiformis]|uniref:Uncharacterized protein n=1 Tax=Irpex rosettiformis TaxID=378272 RepID=A0ACB8UI17_9APHY|nr:hypothetical protein BDY19DRAFT_298223 [Irpex rosettiformis]
MRSSRLSLPLISALSTSLTFIRNSGAAPSVQNFPSHNLRHAVSSHFTSLKGYLFLHNGTTWSAYVPASRTMGFASPTFPRCHCLNSRTIVSDLDTASAPWHLYQLNRSLYRHPPKPTWVATNPNLFFQYFEEGHT